MDRNRYTIDETTLRKMNSRHNYKFVVPLIFFLEIKAMCMMFH